MRHWHAAAARAGSIRNTGRSRAARYCLSLTWFTALSPALFCCIFSASARSAAHG
jgi:hypothetical protein